MSSTPAAVRQEVHDPSELAAHGPVAHHFDDAVQQHDAAELGMWAFLVTEVMFFGGLFLCYAIYRGSMPEQFIAASQTLHVPLGTVNTAVLLTSSLTMALAVSAAQRQNRPKVTLFLVATLVLGAVFLGIKAYEYAEKFHHDHVPLLGWDFDPALPQGSQIFFVLYFIMTGLHAVHMVIGMGILLVLAYWSWWGRTPIRATPIELTGLYWHFVDIVWIFLFPFLYLIKPA